VWAHERRYPEPQRLVISTDGSGEATSTELNPYVSITPELLT